jgi:hypothetical protein
VWLGAGVAVAIVVIAPWSLYSSARFRNPVFLSTELGSTMVQANCPATYSGALLGSANGQCQYASPNQRTGPHGDDTTRDSAMRREAIDFMKQHASQVPVVVLAREGRAWGLFRPLQQMHFETIRGTRLYVIAPGILAFWVLTIAAVPGAIILRRRRVPLFPLMAFLLTVAIGVAITYGSIRYRTPAQVPIVLLAAVAIDVACARWQRSGAVQREAEQRPR